MGKLKLPLKLVLLCVLWLGPTVVAAAPHRDAPRPPFKAQGGVNVELPRDEISEAEWQRVWGEINFALPVHPQVVNYAWPLQLAPGLGNEGYHAVSAFADHNPNAGQLLDYNSGARTYDSGAYNHQGTDYFLWPYSWNKVDSGAVQVIAAADGMIVGKYENTPDDHSCAVNGGNFGNWLALQHGDGRVTLYGHMRYGSLTAKNEGDAVALGEYLGTVASSGNSTGPHLHFEVRAGSVYPTSTVWIDPYYGDANQIPSSWISQRPYYDSAINKIATGHAAPDFHLGNCPQPTTPNLQTHFSYNDTVDVYFHVFYRDLRSNQMTLFYLYEPNGQIYYNWSYEETVTPFTPAAFRYWVYNFPADAPRGQWRFEALFNGQMYTTNFYLLRPQVYLPLVIGD